MSSYDNILKAAAQLAMEKGFNTLTRKEIADAAGVSEALVSFYLGDMDAARNMTLQYACAHRILKIVAQGLSVDHPIAKALPVTDRRAAASHIVGEEE